MRLDRAIIWAVLALQLAACVPVTAPPAGPVAPVQAIAPVLPPREAAQNFISVVRRIEPVAEQLCVDANPNRNCDFQIVVDDRANQPPNAFQTLDANGRPILGFTIRLIADARNADEIAFVLGHEAAHHILGHIPQTRETATAGAVLAGILAQASGASPDAVQAAQEMGATVGARSYSKQFELEADALGARIALVSGYDPVLGAAFFDRIPDPGDRFLGSHPPNSARKAQVAQVVAQYRAAGL